MLLVKIAGQVGEVEEKRRSESFQDQRKREVSLWQQLNVRERHRSGRKVKF